VYKVITLTVKSNNGPCTAVVGYAVDKLGFEREDLVQDIVADYIKQDRGQYDPSKANLNTYINRFVKWCLTDYIKAAKAKKRIHKDKCVSYEAKVAAEGDGCFYKGYPPPGETERLWNLFADLIEEDKNSCNKK